MTTMPTLPTPEPHHDKSLKHRCSVRRSGRATAMHVLLLISGALVGCSSLQGQEPPVPEGLDGYAGVLYLNRTRALVQTIIAFNYSEQPPIVWVNAVAPGSWESLVVECGFDNIDFLSAIPVDISTGQEGDQVDEGADPLRTGEELICGSLIVVEISPGDPDLGEASLVFDVRTIPADLPDNADELTMSAVAPGPDSGLILARFERIEGVASQVALSWDNPTGRVFESRIDVGTAGPVAATLVECPIEEFGWGNVTDPTVPGAILTDPETEAETQLTAPAPLQLGSGIDCGDLVTMRVVGSAAVPSAAHLEIQATSLGSSVPVGAPDLFGNIRSVLDQEGFAGRLSTNLALLPNPGAISQEQP